jgi:hypothetical protein
MGAWGKPIVGDYWKEKPLILVVQGNTAKISISG